MGIQVFFLFMEFHQKEIFKIQKWTEGVSLFFFFQFCDVAPVVIIHTMI